MDFLGDTFPYFRPNYTNMEALRAEFGADAVVGIVPTGWMYQMKKTTFAQQSKETCTIHLVPYSEHSRYTAHGADLRMTDDAFALTTERMRHLRSDACLADGSGFFFPSYSELREYVRWLEPVQVVPTVGVDGIQGSKVRERIEHCPTAPYARWI